MSENDSAKDDLPTDIPSFKRWLRRAIVTVAGTAFTVAVYWTGGFMADAATARVDQHIATVMALQVPAIADPLYVKKIDYLADQQAQVVQANERDLREIRLLIAELQSRLQYGNLSEGERAQIEYRLQVLQAQESELSVRLGT